MATADEGDVESTFSKEFPSEWTAVSLTHVEYIKGDRVGQVLAWFSLLPIFAIVAFVTLIVFRRDLHTISYFAGLVFSEACNWLLKHYIKEARPGRDGRVLFTEYGMPSSHAQFASFLSVYLVLFLFIRVHHNHRRVDNVWKYVTGCVGLVTALLVAYSRVHLGYHTVRQVTWGGLVGSLLSVLWFIIVHVILTPYFPLITSWRLSEFLMIRDSTLIPNVMWFEYTHNRSEARNRQRKARKSI